MSDYGLEYKVFGDVRVELDDVYDCQQNILFEDKKKFENFEIS